MPADKITSMAKGLLNMIIGGIVQWAIPLLVAAILSTGLIIAQSYHIWGDYGLSISIIIVVVLAIATNYVHKRWISVKRVYYPRYSGNFVVESKIYRYTLRKDGYVVISRKMRLKALKANEGYTLEKYLWTGKENADYPVKTTVESSTHPGIEFGEEDRVGIWNFVRVNFGRSVRKGEIIEYEIIHKTRDKNFTSSPFMSTSTEEPTLYLKFELRFDPSLGITAVCKERLRGIESHDNFDADDGIIDEGVYDWEVRRPQLYHHYRIRWKRPTARVARKSSSRRK